MSNDQERRPVNWDQIAWDVAKIGLSAGLLALLATQIDWGSALTVLRRIPLISLGAGLAIYGTGMALMALRLKLLMAAQEVRLNFGTSLKLTFLSAFASNFLPSTVGGDAVKIVALARAGYPKAVTAATVIVDRLANFSVYVLLTPSLITLGGLLTTRIAAETAWLIGGVALLGIGAGAVAAVILVRHEWSAEDRARQGLIGMAIRGVETTRAILARWVRQPATLGAALALSVGVVVTGIGAVGLQIPAMGIEISSLEFVAVITLNYFITLLPISFNGLGLLEFGMVYMLTRMGASPAQAGALALLSRLLYVSTSLPGAWFMITGL